MQPRSFRLPLSALLGFALVTCGAARAQKPANTAVPEDVAVLLRPVLDELQHYRTEGEGDRHLVDEYFYAVTKKQGRFADEALVVLMCFDVMGESQEDTDSVIARGRRMLPFIEKYRNRKPAIAGRTYPDSLLKSSSQKQSDFQGAIKAIKHGWRGTWDNPEG
jgi:hypothetical protein